MPSKPYTVCVTTFTIPVHLHGASFVSLLLLTGRCCGDILFSRDILKGGNFSLFSRDILKGGNIGVLAGGRGVLGVYYLLENIIHYYYCQSEGG